MASRDAEVLRGGTTAMAARVQQLIRLRAMRNAQMGHEMRDRFCFTVYCALLADHSQEEAWKRLLAFNDGFKEPLSDATLQQTMSSASEKRYRLTNSWVIAELEITEDEQEAIGLRPTSGDIVKRRKRNHTRDMIRKTLKEDRDNKILVLFSDGLSKAEIARRLELSWNTVAKVIATEEERRASIQAAQEAEEAMAQVAAGSEGQNAEILSREQDSSKTVHNNIVFYGEPSVCVSVSQGQAIRGRGTDPPS